MHMAAMKNENEEAEATQGARRASEVASSPAPLRPDPEVPDIAKRRRFSASYKIEILRQIDACSEPGEVSALLRREGLYSSTVSGWRRQREKGVLAGLEPKKRGRKQKPHDLRDKVIETQKREIRVLKRKLDQANRVVEIQKKVSSLLGISLENPDDERND